MSYEKYRDNEFNREQLKALNMLISSLKKKYSFVKDWKLAKDFDDYSAILYIDLFVDILEISEILDLKLSEYYEVFKNEPKYLSSSSLTTFFEDKNDSNKNITDITWNLRKKMEEYLNNTYSYLPEKFRIKYYLYRETGNLTFDVYINIGKFIVYQS
jgi:hypothetical protein